MQVFSKLQRNSTYSILIKVVFYFLLAVFNSQYYFFPLLLGIVIMGELDIIIYLFFISILHNFNFLYLLFIFIGYNFYLKEKISSLINREYQISASIFVIYFLMFLYLKDITYLTFNFLIDLVIFNLKEIYYVKRVH